MVKIKRPRFSLQSTLCFVLLISFCFALHQQNRFVERRIHKLEHTLRVEYASQVFEDKIARCRVRFHERDLTVLRVFPVDILDQATMANGSFRFSAVLAVMPMRADQNLRESQIWECMEPLNELTGRASYGRLYSNSNWSWSSKYDIRQVKNQCRVHVTAFFSPEIELERVK